MKQELLSEATRVLKRDMGRIGKRNSRIHDDTAEDNVQRLRAIDGICGSCNNLKIEFFDKGDREGVVLRCTVGFSPLDLYRKTEFGKEADCRGFIEASLNENLYV